MASEPAHDVQAAGDGADIVAHGNYRPSTAAPAHGHTAGPETLVRPPARKQAIVEAVAAWACAGWPRQLISHEAYAVQHHLEDYVLVCFPGRFSCEVRTSIVFVTLKAFVPYAYSDDEVDHAPTVDDLLHGVIDEALDRLHSGDPLRPSLKSRATDSGSRDQEIVWEIFGNHVSRDAVIETLRRTVARRETLEFHVVTKYLDLTDIGKSRPSLVRVVEALQPLISELGMPSITEAEVQSALFRFCNRLPRDE